MSSQRVARVSLLAALAVALRFSFVAFPNVKPITAIFLVAVFYMGLLDAVLVMALTMVVTGIFLGFGPVVLWQIASFAAVMVLWSGLIPFRRVQRLSGLFLEASLAAILVMVYGFLISLFSSVQFGFSLFPYWVNGLVFDGLHAVSTFLFYPIIYSIFRRFFR